MTARLRILVVSDQNGFDNPHNFRLRGPGVNRATGVPFAGRRVWTVTLRPGVYRFLCDPHELAMHGSFRVTAWFCGACGCSGAYWNQRADAHGDSSPTIESLVVGMLNRTMWSNCAWNFAWFCSQPAANKPFASSEARSA